MSRQLTSHSPALFKHIIWRKSFNYSNYNSFYKADEFQQDMLFSFQQQILFLFFKWHNESLQTSWLELIPHNRGSRQLHFKHSHTNMEENIEEKAAIPWKSDLTNIPPPPMQSKTKHCCIMGWGSGNETKEKSVKYKNIVNWVISTLVDINSISLDLKVME